MRNLLIEQSMLSAKEHSLNIYLNELVKVNRITPQEEVFLSKKIREGDNSALEKLVKANLLFVVSCAKKYQNKGMPLTDLINEGNIGLIRAAYLFDETRGFKFISYAVWWIRQSIMMALSIESRMIRLPQNMVKITGDIRKTAEMLEQRLERPPTDKDILEELYVPNQKIAMDYAFGSSVTSLDSLVRQDGESELWSILPDPNAKWADDDLQVDANQLQIKELLAVVGEREQHILRQYFGFEDGMPRSIEVIGEQLGISAERTRQLKHDALEKLRRKIGEKKYDYV